MLRPGSTVEAAYVSASVGYRTDNLTDRFTILADA